MGTLQDIGDRLENGPDTPAEEWGEGGEFGNVGEGDGSLWDLRDSDGNLFFDQGGEPDIGDQEEFAPRSISGEISVIQGVPIIYGQVRTEGVVVFKELVEGSLAHYWWDRHIWYLDYLLCEGTINGLAGVWVDEKYVQTYPITSGQQTLTYGNADKGKYSLNWNVNNGYPSASGSGSQTFGKSHWISVTGLSFPETNVLKGLAHVGIKYTYGDNLDERDAQLAKIAFNVRGKYVRDVYDNFASEAFRYRPVGSGSTADQYGTNPALCLLDYLTNTTFGAGISTSDIDLSAFRTAQYYCDEQPETGVPRFSCNIELDSARPLVSNIKDLLKCCNGQLLWVDGKYMLKIDQVQSSQMTFDETSIIGGINILGESNSTKANQVTASFIEPDQSWKMDTVSWPDKVLDASTYTQFLDTEDGGMPSRRKITLKGVASSGGMRDMSDNLSFVSGRIGYKQARYLAQLACLQSRNNIGVSFRATTEALNLIPGDSISITHPTPAWSAKQFIVRKVGMNVDGSVSINCVEYQAATYTWNQATAPAIVADTTLPDPSNVVAPTGLEVTESVYSSIKSGGTKIRATLIWIRALDYFVNGYDFQFKLSADSTWTEAGATVSGSAIMNDFEKGTFDFRVRSKNTTGAVSAWVTIINQVIAGASLSAPQNVVNFEVNINSADANTVVATWDAPTETDLIAGGHLEIRNLMSGASDWEEAEVLATVGGSSTSALLPLMEGNYIAKWIGSDGLEALIFQESGLGTVFWTNTTDSVDYHTEFAGTKTNLFVADNDGAKILKFVSEGNWDDFIALDSITTLIDEHGGTATEGIYISEPHDMEKVFKMRLYTKKVFTSGVSDGSNYMDTWGTVDARNSWDEVSRLAGVTSYLRTTVDDPASPSAGWTAYKKFQVADVQARGVQLKVQFESDLDGAEQFRMTQLSLLFDMKSKVFGENALSTATVTYTETFHQKPILLVTPKNMVSGDYMTISNETSSGFGINFFNSSGVGVTRDYNYLAEGVG
jgi:hypothetical protein